MYILHIWIFNQFERFFQYNCKMYINDRVTICMHINKPTCCKENKIEIVLYITLWIWEKFQQFLLELRLYVVLCQLKYFIRFHYVTQWPHLCCSGYYVYHMHTIRCIAFFLCFNGAMFLWITINQKSNNNLQKINFVYCLLIVFLYEPS